MPATRTRLIADSSFSQQGFSRWHTPKPSPLQVRGRSGVRAGADEPQQLGRLCCIWSTGGMPKPCLAEGSDRQGQFVERGGNSKACWLLYCELVVATPKVLHKACPASTTVALRSCLSPGIGRSRAFSRPWSHSMRLLAYWSVRCHAAGSRSSSTAGYAAARSVVTSIGVT